MALARPFREPLLAARIESPNESYDALVLHARGARRKVVEIFFLYRAAKAPIPAVIERQIAPQRNPLAVLLDAVGLDVTLGRARFAGAYGERAVRDHAMTTVVDVFRAPKQLTLREFDHRGQQILM